MPALRPAITAPLLAAALALAGCATGGAGSAVQVTRFHLGQAIAPGSIAVEPRDPVIAGSLEFGAYQNAVGAELNRLGFRPAPQVAGSELVAVVDVNRGFREGPPRGPAFSIGVGGASFGRHSAVGGGVGVPIAPERGRELVGTELAVQIKRRSEGTVVWEGRARFEAAANGPLASPDASAQRLASALFAGFPGETGRTILVK